MRADAVHAFLPARLFGRVLGLPPPALAAAAIALIRLAALTGEQRYANHADRILQLIAGVIEKAPGQHSNALVAADLRLRGVTEVVIVGDRPELVRLAQSIWRPDTVLAWGEPYESPLWQERRGRPSVWVVYWIGVSPMKSRPPACSSRNMVDWSGITR